MRVGDSVWFAKRISGENAETAEYAEPIEIKTKFNYLTVQPFVEKNYIQILPQGETETDKWKGIAMARNFKDFFHKGDVMWIDGESPYSEKNAPLEEMYGYGATANAVIKSAPPVNITINITLERNQNQVKQ